MPGLCTQKRKGLRPSLQTVDKTIRELSEGPLPL